jgi:hypothetical protein
MPLFIGVSEKTEKLIKPRKPEKITKKPNRKKNRLKKTKPNPNQAKLEKNRIKSKQPSQTGFYPKNRTELN